MTGRRGWSAAAAAAVYSLLAAAIVVGAAAQPAPAQVVTERSAFSYRAGQYDGAFRVQFGMPSTGEIRIVVRWKGSKLVGGSRIPLAVGLKLSRDQLTYLAAQTAGDASGLVTLIHQPSDIEVSSTKLWMARVDIQAPNLNGVEISGTLEVTHPPTAEQSGFDLAITDVKNTIATAYGGDEAQMMVSVSNRGRRELNSGIVRCTVDTTRFIAYVYSLAADATRELTLRGSGAVGRSLLPGTYTAQCRAEAPLDANEANDVRSVSVTVLPQELPRLAIERMELVHCTPGSLLVAGQPGCVWVRWSNYGGGFGGGWTANCTVGSQTASLRVLGVKADGWTGRGDQLGFHLPIGNAPAGRQPVRCSLDSGIAAADLAALQRTAGTIVVVPAELRADLSVVRMLPRVEDGATEQLGTPNAAIRVLVKNQGTVTVESYAVECTVNGVRYTATREFSLAPADSEWAVAKSEQTLSSLAEGTFSGTCTVEIRKALLPDAVPANSTLTVTVSVSHAGHEPFVDFRSAYFFEGTGIDVTVYIGAQYGAAAPRPAMKVLCVRDIAGTDLSGHLEADALEAKARGFGGYDTDRPKLRWTDLKTDPPSEVMLHLEAWDSATPPSSSQRCKATTNPLSGPISPPTSGLWSMAEFRVQLPWTLPVTMARSERPNAADQAGAISGGARGAAPSISRPSGSGGSKQAPAAAPKRDTVPPAPSTMALGIPSGIPAPSARAPVPTDSAPRMTRPDSARTPTIRPAPRDAAPAPTTRSRCDEGCFDAAVTGAASASFAGIATVNADDGSRFELLLRNRRDEGEFVTFARDPGGPLSRTGTYRLVNVCGEPSERDVGQFGGEYHKGEYRETNPAIFHSREGTLTIERIGEGRVVGRFSFVACGEEGEDGKPKEIRVRGTFDAPWIRR